MNYKKIFQIFFFQVFKPINPIDYDGRNIFQYNNILRKFFYTFRDTTVKKIFNGWLLSRVFMLLKESLIFIISLIYLPVILIVSLSPYRFIHVNAWQIGAYVQSFDTIIKNNKLRKKKYKLIFLYPKFLKSNIFLDKFYKKEILSIENFLLYLVCFPLIISRFSSINNWEFETINPNSKFNYVHHEYKRRFGSYILAEDNYIDLKKNLINIEKKLNIDLSKRIISIHIKEDDFYNSSKSRSFNKDTLLDTINYLIQKNFLIIFFKSMQFNIFNFKNKNFIEFVINDDQSKFEQYILLKSSHLVICHQGGIHAYNQIINVPFLQINSSPININPCIKDSDFIILKKFYDIHSNEYLSFNEILKQKLHLYINRRYLDKKKIDIVENNSIEILDSVAEILEKKFDPSTKKYKKHLPQSLSFTFSDSEICSSYLYKNNYLLKN